ncbi:hypothetical protein DLAC_09050 [Tieghemostelium lacteum]|uniref:Uncharacterized protein n=1 Tax=Tieghemostelium lacteum TaxID=361077 RepID=A0A151Z911_TIELA|nr:hypothetical protein DLAC_09050 [Tieghemostelium lacteum]|eukprot:KYQ90429.1 hypothetical protein DLAC_09050 [Tieghemostelium lacteum]
MEAIVLKVLKKYFKLFIKNFKSDNFSMSLLKGEGTLVDLDLNETIIQDLLLIPPQFKVTQAICDQLSAKIPWTSFKKEPITISLQNITINLKEPETITPIQSQLKKFKKKTKNKRNEITENLQIEVKSLKLNIATLHGRTLMIEIDDILIQSTNSNFQIVELSQMKNIDKESGTESLHKLITAKSISIKIQDEGGLLNIPLVENLPLKVLFSSKRRTRDWIQVSAKVEFILKNLNLNWTISQWHSIMELVSTIQNTLARSVPVSSDLNSSSSSLKSSKDKKKSSSTSLKKSSKKDKSEVLSPNSISSSPVNVSPSISRLNNESNSSGLSSSPNLSPMSNNSVNVIADGDSPLPVAKHSDFSYEFHIEKWALELVDNFSQAGNAFQFNGDGLHFAFTSANTLQRPMNSETNQPYYSIPIRETILSAIIKSLTIQETSLNSSKKIELCITNENRSKKYDKSITSISSDAMPERIQIHQYTGPFLLKGNLIFRKPITASSPTTPNDSSESVPTTTATTTTSITTTIDPLKLIMNGGPPLIGLELNVHLNDLKLNGDRRSWKSLISFLIPPEDDIMTSESENETTNMIQPHDIQTSESLLPPNTNNSVDISTVANSQLVEVQDSPKLFSHTSPLHQGNSTTTTHRAKVIIEKGKKKISTFKKKLKLGDNWKNQIKLAVKATNTEIVVRDEKVPEYKGLEAKIKLGTMVLGNHSEWKSVPYLMDGLQLADKYAVSDPISRSGLDHRISLQIENFSLDFIQSSVVAPQAVITPSTITLYLRLSRSFHRNEKDKRIPKIDVSFNSLDFNFTLNTLQSEFLDHLANKYLSPKKMKNLLKSRIKNLKNEAKKRLKRLDEKNLDKTLTIKNKVEKTLQQYFWNCYINVKKGQFHLPLEHLLEPKHQQANNQQTGENTDAQTLIDTITQQPGSQIEKLSEIKVQSLGILLQNKDQGQNIVIKIGSIEAYGIDHPKMSTSCSLRPLPIPDDEYIPSATHDDTNLLITYQRRAKKLSQSLINQVLMDNELNEYLTEVWVKLQGTQVRIQKKTNTHLSDPTATKSTKSKIKMPDLKNFITKAVNLIERRKDRIKDIKKGIKKVNLNLRWGLELGNCEILLGDKSKKSLNQITGSTGDVEEYQPKGIIKITDTNRKSNASSYKQMENELLKKNSESARNEEEREIYTDKIQSMQEELDSIKSRYETELSTLRQQYEELEAKFVSTKLELAELSSR